jgi:hypothetical protein
MTTPDCIKHGEPAERPKAVNERVRPLQVVMGLVLGVVSYLSTSVLVIMLFLLSFLYFPHLLLTKALVNKEVPHD